MTKLVKKENIYNIAKRIYSLILQNFTSKTVVRLDANANKHITVEKSEDKIENNLTKNKKTCDNKNESLFTSQFVLINATLIESNMTSLYVRFMLLNRKKII